ncbi:hypothetical protein N879_17420 [Alcaligenes sp. EGD-AK7]|nr:hypothetical protein N879_17420 [Alcaligenes sp. EGD-AK7]
MGLRLFMRWPGQRCGFQRRPLRFACSQSMNRFLESTAYPLPEGMPVFSLWLEAWI